MLITMLSVGYGDISPKTETEIIITMFATIAGIVFFGILLGSIAEALTVRPCFRLTQTLLYALPRSWWESQAQHCRAVLIP